MHYSIEIFKQEKVGWESIHCSKMVEMWLRVPDDFIMGVVGLAYVTATVWCLQHGGSDTVQSLFQSMNSALFSTGQEQHCGHCNRAVPLSKSNYLEITWTFQGGKFVTESCSSLSLAAARYASFVHNLSLVNVAFYYATKSWLNFAIFLVRKLQVIEFFEVCVKFLFWWKGFLQLW